MPQSSLLELVMGQLQGGGLAAISRQVGVSEEQASQVAAGALPALLGGLARNSSQPSGAEALLGALTRDHDGSVLDDLAGFLGGGGATSQGAGILGHVFGSRQPALEQSLGQSTGIKSSQVGQILAMLAPLVLGALGKQQRQGGLDAGGLASMLQNERSTVRSQSPGLDDALGRLLDQDGDGSALDDVARLGTSLLGGLFGKK